MNLGKNNLVNIEVAEISLVDKAANKRIFYLKKNDGVIKMEKTIEFAKSIGIEDIEELLGKVSQEKQEKIKNVLGNFSKYSETLTDEIKESLKNLVSESLKEKSEAAPQSPADSKKDTNKGDEDGTLKSIITTLDAVVSAMENISAKTNKGDDGNAPGKEKKDDNEDELAKTLKSISERLSNIEKVSGGKSTIDTTKADETQEMTGKFQNVRKQMGIG